MINKNSFYIVVLPGKQKSRLYKYNIETYKMGKRTYNVHFADVMAKYASAHFMHILYY